MIGGRIVNGEDTDRAVAMAHHGRLGRQRTVTIEAGIDGRGIDRAVTEETSGGV